MLVLAVLLATWAFILAVETGYLRWLVVGGHLIGLGFNIMLWGTWLISQVVFFSVARDWDPHYLAMLTPAVGALVGAGVVALWHDYRSAGWRGWLLPLTLVGTASLQLHILAHYPEWSHWLAPAIVILGLSAAVSLVVAQLKPPLKCSGLPLALVAISVGVLSLLLAPTIWAASTVWYGGLCT